MWFRYVCLLSMLMLGCTAENEPKRCTFHDDCDGLCVDGVCSDAEGTGGASAEAQGVDCRNDGRGCTAPFVCRDAGSGLYECLDETTNPVDCRNDDRGCNAPFECLQTPSGAYDCLQTNPIDDADDDTAIQGGQNGSDGTNDDTLGPCETIAGIVYTPPTVRANTPIRLDTTRGPFSSEGSCGGAIGPEMVVMFEVTSPLDAFTVDTFSVDTEIATTTYIRKAECLAPEAEIICEQDALDAVQPGYTVTVKAPELGTYFIFVDSLSVGGPVSLLVTTQVPSACGNGVDDDDDGLVDYPHDPGCRNPQDRDEVDELMAPACANGLDDDSDGATDFPEDLGCLAASWPEERNRCGPEVHVTEYIYGTESMVASTGDDGASNILNPTEDACGRRDRAERVFLYRHPFKGDITLRTDYPDTEILTTVYVRDKCLENAVDLACDDANGGLGGTSRLVIEDASPGEYFVVVETTAGPVGRFRLGLSSNRKVTACSDELDNDGDGRIDDDDPGCIGASDISETDYVGDPSCNNGVDDDLDGKTDYPFDPGCEARGDQDECDSGRADGSAECLVSDARLPACINGLDDDYDGLVDVFMDPGCTAFGDDDETDLRTPTACVNGRDDDGDGLRDYPDDPACDFLGDRSEE